MLKDAQSTAQYLADSNNCKTYLYSMDVNDKNVYIIKLVMATESYEGYPLTLIQTFDPKG